jgi:hypothetical protein
MAQRIVSSPNPISTEISRKVRPRDRSHAACVISPLVIRLNLIVFAGKSSILRIPILTSLLEFSTL